MNKEWMRERLERFRALCEEYDLANRRASYKTSAATDRLYSEITFEVPTAQEIIRRLNPGLVAGIKPPSYPGGAAVPLHTAELGLAILRDQDEWKANLAPDAPSLVADQFHPSVWTAASAIWETGQYRVAVQQSCVSLSAHIAAKAGSSLTERALVAQVFSKEEPKLGQVRLHIPGDKSTDNWKSRQDGLHLLAQGAFAGIRNVATHTDDEWTEQVALEHLAVLSVVARWADETQLAK